MNRRDFVIAAAAGLTASSLPLSLKADSPPPITDIEPLQKLIDDIAAELGIVGGQMALFDGHQIYEFCTGYANLELGLRVTNDTLFQIGSTTKVFNAAMIMTQVDAGVLDLDAPVKTWIKDFKLPDPQATETVCLRQLLSMSAGIDNGPYQDYGRGDDALPQYVASLAEVPMIFPPGTAFGYSNASTNISGLTAQRATGKSWDALLAEHVLAPLSLNQSATLPENLLYQRYALGYSYQAGAEIPERVPVWGLPRSMAPAGASLCCSAGDLVRFAQMFLRGGKADNGTQVVSADRIKTMHTPQVTLPTRLTAEKWCTGPYWKKWDNYVIYGHSGTNTGGSSLLLWCPERNVAIATLSNVPNQGYPFADKVFSYVFPQVFGIKKPVRPQPGDVMPLDIDLRPFTGTFEAWNQRRVFSIEEGKLMARIYNNSELPEPELTTELLPLGDKRFLPANPAMSGNRGWDVAFWGSDAARQAGYFLDGVFAMRRTG